MTSDNDSARARESARRADGRFGSQPLDEAGDVTLFTTDTPDAWGDARVLLDEIEEINGQWRDQLMCAEMVVALDRDAEQNGYDALQVVRLILRPVGGDDDFETRVVEAIGHEGETVRAFRMPSRRFRDRVVPASLAASRGHDVAVEVAAVRGQDWTASELAYRKRIVAAVLGERYHLGVSFAW